MNKHHWVEIAEYMSLAGSFLGTITAVTSSQVGYAVAPLTLALSLNVVNRHRLQQAYWETSLIVFELHEVVQSVQQQVQALPPELKHIKQSLAQLERKTEALTHRFNGRIEPRQIDKLKRGLTKLSEDIAKLQPYATQTSAPMRKKPETRTQRLNSQAELERIEELDEAATIVATPSQFGNDNTFPMSETLPALTLTASEQPALK